MKCPNCGNELEPGKIYCDHCGHEIQIVPDYDPLDELLIGREEPEEPGSGTTPNPETPVENREKKPFREKKKPMVLRFRYKCLLFLAAVLVCGCVSWFSYSAITSDHNYSYQLRKGRRYAEKGGVRTGYPVSAPGTEAAGWEKVRRYRSIPPAGGRLCESRRQRCCCNLYGTGHRGGNEGPG